MHDREGTNNRSARTNTGRNDRPTTLGCRKSDRPRSRFDRDLQPIIITIRVACVHCSSMREGRGFYYVDREAGGQIICKHKKKKKTAIPSAGSYMFSSIVKPRSAARKKMLSVSFSMSFPFLFPFFSFNSTVFEILARSSAYRTSVFQRARARARFFLSASPLRSETGCGDGKRKGQPCHASVLPERACGKCVTVDSFKRSATIVHSAVNYVHSAICIPMYRTT